MFHKLRRTVAAVTALAALALGGSALAGAATGSNTTTTPSASSGSGSGSAPQGQPPAGAPNRDPSKGGHQANGKTETLLTADTAAKVKAAAEAKVSGGTVERVENDADSSSPYEAHVKKADGTEVVVLVNKDFQVTAVNAMQHP